MGKLRVAANASILHLERFPLLLDLQQRVYGVEEMTCAFSKSSVMIEIVMHRWSRVGR